jgi:hypothetical protein
VSDKWITEPLVEELQLIYYGGWGLDAWIFNGYLTTVLVSKLCGSQYKMINGCAVADGTGI